MKTQLGRHISEQFNLELESLRTHVLAMGGLVEEQFSLSLQALLKQDMQLAKKVHQDDQKVNQMEMAIDEACTRVIAKRQPTARDLRLVLAIIKTISDLERVGDAAKRIARVAQDAFSHQQSELLIAVEALGRIAVNMLHQVLDAFARMDIKAAAQVYQMDQHIEQQYKMLRQQLIEFMQQDAESISKVMLIMSGVHTIQRVGDRCQNICEYIVYFVEGKDVRHDPHYLMSLLD
ncbi:MULTISPECIES: phosphate signaling complex protein PhoU [Vibrio]|uniref:Phosphate-specific transport system accessory protein PhoU n=1 Tax=Vibrio algicola TaxID=2662262 RepID=A0A5Q0TEF4_9VIBR|nr:MULTISPECIES: phosphate signaling complex protein PhoU [Vibrio]MBD1576697.1 phosphate signaling complex protein PhoU [Vibrio sp. S11_S32]